MKDLFVCPKCGKEFVRDGQYKAVLDMYSGKYITINSYEKYFQRLNEGIKIMQDSKKREFSFLDTY